MKFPSDTELRVIEEAKELYLKTDKLNKFLSKGMPEGFEASQWVLLEKQCLVMAEYHSILLKRIELF